MNHILKKLYFKMEKNNTSEHKDPFEESKVERDENLANPTGSKRDTKSTMSSSNESTSKHTEQKVLQKPSNFTEIENEYISTSKVLQRGVLVPSFISITVAIKSSAVTSWENIPPVHTLVDYTNEIASVFGGMEELFQTFANAGWLETVLTEDDQDQPPPILHPFIFIEVKVYIDSDIRRYEVSQTNIAVKPDCHDGSASFETVWQTFNSTNDLRWMQRPELYYLIFTNITTGGTFQFLTEENVYLPQGEYITEARKVELSASE